MIDDAPWLQDARPAHLVSRSTAGAGAAFRARGAVPCRRMIGRSYSTGRPAWVRASAAPADTGRNARMPL